MSTFEILIDQRKKQRITQKDLAKSLKITASTLNKYEQGKRNISASMQDEYAILLGFELKVMVK